MSAHKGVEGGQGVTLQHGKWNPEKRLQDCTGSVYVVDDM